MKNGIIISFEGPDDTGKTAILEQVLPILQEKGYDIVTTREPGGAEITERIRDVILDVNHVAVNSKAELLLYVAARRRHYAEKILPTLGTGKVTLIDRFIDSSIAYRGAERGLDKDITTRLNDFITDGRKPNLTLYFGVESEISLARIAKNAEREINRLDLERLDMYKCVREGYLALAERGKRIVTIDVSRGLADVMSETLHTILEQLAGNGQKDLDGIRALATPTS